MLRGFSVRGVHEHIFLNSRAFFTNEPRKQGENSMRSLKTVRCLSCHTEYETKFIKFRVQLFTHTYEKCPNCGKWSMHKIVLGKIEKTGKDTTLKI